jgi:hypothetical protein
MNAPWKVDRFGEGERTKRTERTDLLGEAAPVEDKRHWVVRLLCSLRPWGKAGVKGKVEF